MVALLLSRPRVLVLLLALGIIATSLIVTSDHHNYWGVFDGAQVPEPPARPEWPAQMMSEDEIMLSKLVIVFPVNENTDMQFYRNTWFGEYLHPVCDFDGPDCKIVCNQASTYRTLDKKTFCFSRQIKEREEYKQTEFFIKLDDDSFIDKGYILQLMRNNTGSDKPVYISDHTRIHDRANPGVLDEVLYGNGKFYMFNRVLVNCLDTDLKYNGRRRNEDLVFGGMVNSGCGGEKGVMFIQENDDKIWHKVYHNKNKYIELGYIKNH
ncbi:hypothetical protein LPJ53_001485 [Coemansia erecta]|uniref:Uncharacterized protein n=1 Tax=Coemansia erecta TaxID=147472 RepID=A0A9W8CS32_9FUNG|nr:hypothetical protein LPJ53_001485 [Coemansia erecta]